MNGIANSFAAHLALDPYNRAARLTPALLTIAPVVVLFYCFYGTSNPLLSAIVSLLGWCGGGYALTRIARNAGSRIQDTLFEKWGGAPTTQLLRHSTPDIDPYTKARCHSILAKALKTPAPTAESEAANPAAADNFYRAATRWLIAQTKDTKKFPAVFRENVAFGFQRNMLGLRPIGLIIAASTLAADLLACASFEPYRPFLKLAAITTATLPIKISMGFSGAILFAWMFMFSEAATRRTGFAYAERLILSCDETATAPKGGRQATKGTAPA
jgi:hypothetical protein